MKKFLNCSKRCFCGLIAIMISLFSISPITSYAVDITDRQNKIALKEMGLTKEEAIAIFDLTEEEAKHATFYVMDVDQKIPTAQTRGTINPHDIWAPPEFHFTGYNGGSYQTMNGTKLKYRMLWKPDPGDESEFCEVYLCGYGLITYSHYLLFTLAAPEYINNPSYRDLTSEWINIYYGLDYRFTYESMTGHGSMYPTEHGCSMRVAVVVVNI